MIKLKRN